MEQPSSSVREMTRRLLAPSGVTGAVHGPDAARSFEDLRIQLSRLVGNDGYASLLRRAVGLAAVEIPALHSLRVGPDAGLEGIDSVAPEAALALAAHLLGLLVTFIGEPLTLRVVGDAWPDSADRQQLE